MRSLLCDLRILFGFGLSVKEGLVTFIQTDGHHRYFVRSFFSRRLFIVHFFDGSSFAFENVPQLLHLDGLRRFVIGFVATSDNLRSHWLAPAQLPLLHFPSHSGFFALVSPIFPANPCFLQNAKHAHLAQRPFRTARPSMRTAETKARRKE